MHVFKIPWRHYFLFNSFEIASSEASLASNDPVLVWLSLLLALILGGHLWSTEVSSFLFGTLSLSQKCVWIGFEHREPSLLRDHERDLEGTWASFRSSGLSLHKFLHLLHSTIAPLLTSVSWVTAAICWTRNQRGLIHQKITQFFRNKPRTLFGICSTFW